MTTPKIAGGPEAVNHLLLASDRNTCLEMMTADTVVLNQEVTEAPMEVVPVLATRLAVALAATSGQVLPLVVCWGTFSAVALTPATINNPTTDPTLDGGPAGGLAGGQEWAWVPVWGLDGVPVGDHLGPVGQPGEVSHHPQRVPVQELLQDLGVLDAGDCSTLDFKFVKLKFRSYLVIF